MKLFIPILILCTTGCALLNKAEVQDRRYYSPELPPKAQVQPVEKPRELKLGRVTAAADVQERIMYRASAHEAGYYDDRFWTEPPEEYLKRDLNRVLFEELGLQSVTRGAAQTLNVELISFEEVKAPKHLSRVQVRFTLTDENRVAVQKTLTLEQPIAGKEDNEATAVAKAMGEALRDAVYGISGQVAEGLEQLAQQKAAGVPTGEPVVSRPGQMN